MNVIWRYNERVQSIAALHVGAIVQNIDNHVGDRRLAKIEGANSGFLK